jgi:DNA-binding MarR family transcriptional regulator
MLRSVSSQDGKNAAAVVHDLVTAFIRLTPRELSLTSLSVLSTLDRGGARRITDLAASEGVTQPSVTALVTSLVGAGYVERHSDPADRRVVMVAITEAGSAFLRHRRAVNLEAFSEVFDKLSHEEAATLTAALPVIEHLRELVDELRGPNQGRKSSGPAR